MSVGSLTTNIVQLTPDYGMLSAYFNRGMLATQATAHALHENGDLDSMKQELLRRIADESDQLRIDLAGDMIEAMTTLPKEAAEKHGKVWCALYEFEDTQLIGTLTDLAGNANVILSNMPGKVDGARTDDTYAPERKKARASRVNVIDRMMPGGHIGHNKFTILDDGGPKAVQFGSTNWTDRALCAQSNNTIIARSPGVAAAYMKYWNDLKTDTEAGDGKGKQASSLRSADGAGPVRVNLEDGSGTVDLWFSPNTKTARQRNHAKEPTPPDLQQVFEPDRRREAGDPVRRFRAGHAEHHRSHCQGPGRQPRALRPRHRHCRQGGTGLRGRDQERCRRRWKRRHPVGRQGARRLPGHPCRGDKRSGGRVGKGAQLGRLRDHPQQVRGHRPVLRWLRRRHRKP
jgi:hypothetical protein